MLCARMAAHLGIGILHFEGITSTRRGSYPVENKRTLGHSPPTSAPSPTPGHAPSTLSRPQPLGSQGSQARGVAGKPVGRDGAARKPNWGRWRGTRPSCHCYNGRPHPPVRLKTRGGGCTAKKNSARDARQSEKQHTGDRYPKMGATRKTSTASTGRQGPENMLNEGAWWARGWPREWLPC